MRILKEKRKLESEERKIVLEDLDVHKIKRNAISLESNAQRDSRFERSLRKLIIKNTNEKDIMKKNLKYIRSIFKHGEKFIKNR